MTNRLSDIGANSFRGSGQYCCVATHIYPIDIVQIHFDRADIVNIATDVNIVNYIFVVSMASTFPENYYNHSDLTIKSDTGQKQTILHCFI